VADEGIGDAAQAHLHVWCVVVWGGRAADKGGVREGLWLAPLAQAAAFCAGLLGDW